jgi:hypothetical protein
MERNPAIPRDASLPTFYPFLAGSGEGRLTHVVLPEIPLFCGPDCENPGQLQESLCELFPVPAISVYRSIQIER